MAGGHQSRCAIEDSAEVVRIAQLRLPSRDTHPVPATQRSIWAATAASTAEVGGLNTSAHSVPVCLNRKPPCDRPHYAEPRREWPARLIGLRISFPPTESDPRRR